MEMAIRNINLYADAIVRNAHVMNGVKHVEIPVDLLVLDEPYQRPESGYANRIAQSWDAHKANDITVSYRDGEFKVVDGANRARAAKLAGQQSVNCIIYEGLTMAQEAQLFVSQDENKKKISSYDKFKAQVISGDPSALTMKAMCEEFNVKLQNQRAIGAMNSIQMMRIIYTNHGSKGLRWAFSVIEVANWHYAEGAYGEVILRALCSLYPSSVSDATFTVDLTNKLKNQSPKELIARGTLAYPERSKCSAVCAFVELLMRQKDA